MIIRRISSILILTLILMMSIIVMPDTTEKASAIGLPLKVDITDATKYVNVGPGQPAFTSLSFTVSSLGPNPLRKVTASVAYTAGITSASVSPQQFVVSSASPQTVTVYVSVDRSIEAPTQASVGLTVTDDTGIGAGASGAVVINQFSFLVIDPATPYQEIPPGTPFTYYFKILNQGNGVEPVNFKVTNQVKLEEAGWTITVPPVQSVNMRQFVTVKVSGTTPRTWGWTSRFETLTFQVSSGLKGMNFTQEYTVTTFLRGFFVPAFDPMFTIMAISLVTTGLYYRKNEKPNVPQESVESGGEIGEEENKDISDKSLEKPPNQDTTEDE